MPPQVSKEAFALALKEMGHDPDNYRGKRMTLKGMCELYELEQDNVALAIDMKHIAAHYDYHADTIWVDALDAAHFYFCIQHEAHMYADT